MGSASLGLGSSAQAADLASYGKLPSIEDADVSPNGKRLAVVRTDGERRVILIIDLETRKPLGGIDGADKKVRNIQWADDDHLLLTVNETTSFLDVTGAARDWSTGLIYDVSTKTQKPLLGKMDVRSLNVILSRPVIRILDGKPVAFIVGISFPDEQGVLTVFRTDLTTGQSRPLVTGGGDTRDFLIGEDGQVAADLQYNARRKSAVIRIREGKTLRQAILPADARDLSLEGFSADGQSVLVSYNEGEEDNNILAVASTTSADWQKLNSGDQTWPMFDPVNSRLSGFAALKDNAFTYDFSSAADRKIWSAIQKAYDNDQVVVVGRSADRRKVVIRADSPRDGPTYMLVDANTGEVKDIGPAYDGVKAADISPVKPVSYTAADGTKISGYLTLPQGKGDGGKGDRGKGDKGLPLIVLPHGGPASRDQPGFDWWAQALASRGYAVLQPNFRGSTGYGRAFLEAGFGQFGRKMQTDLSDGVRYLAGEGTIDPKRVCIVGASYGGYAALAGATLDKGVYRCAASIAGPADLRRMLITERTDSGRSAFQYWAKFMGVDGLKDPDLAAISPVAHAAEVTIPVLLVHGKDDTVVLYEQSKIMADALKKAGKPVEFVTLEGEDHHLSRGATRLKMLQAVTAFVEKNNPPD